MDTFSLVVGIGIGCGVTLAVTFLPFVRQILRDHRETREEVRRAHAEMRAHTRNPGDPRPGTWPVRIRDS